MMKIYADNAATTKMSRTALEAMLPYMTEHFGNPSSLYTIGQEAKEGLEAGKSHRRAVHRRAPREITISPPAAARRQPGNPLGSAARREKGKKAHHFDQI